MTLHLSNQSRIVPLTEAVWNRMNPSQDPLHMRLSMYANPKSGNPSVSDGWLFASEELREKYGSTYGDMYDHLILESPAFLQKVKQLGVFEDAFVGIYPQSSGRLCFEFKRADTKEVIHQIVTLPDPGDMLPKEWASPVRDQAFVDKILALGKGYEFCEEKRFRFETVIELAAGMVYTIAFEHTPSRLYLCHSRFNIKDFPLEQSDDCVVENGVIRLQSEMYPRYVSKDLLCKIAEDFSEALRISPVDSSDHKELVSIVWQRREDLFPENW